MLYFLSDSLTETLEGFDLEKQGMIWVVIGVEHLIFLGLIIVKVGIPDMPRKMRKLLLRARAELDEKKDVGDDARIQELLAENERLRNGGKSEKERVMEIIHHHQEAKKDIEIRPGRLADFLGIDPRIGEYEETMEYLEVELTRNFETKLFRETFLLIERAIL